MMRARLLSLLLLSGMALPSAARAQDPARQNYVRPQVVAVGGTDSIGLYGTKTTSNNLINLTISNSGGWGVGFTSASIPNMTYPAGLPYEHMVRGGLWIGAKVLCPDCDTSAHGQRIAVSFGSQDEDGGQSTPLTEYTPLPNTASNRISERSNLANSPFFSKFAVSEQDLVARFRDTPGNRVGSEPHVPLNVEVTESMYSWSFSFAESFVIQHLVIKNTGDLLRDVYVTHYTEMQSLNKAIYANYPASPLRPSPYSKKKLTYFPELRLIAENYCESPQNCHLERVPAYAGVMILGTHPDTVVNLNPKILTHKYAGTGLDEGTPYARVDDSEKYAFQQLPGDIEAQSPGSSDPSQWLTVGPIPSINRGDSVVVDFAFVGGMSPEEIKTTARHAQLAFDLNYKLPTPPPSPRMYARPVEQGVELLWEGSPDTTFDSTGPDGAQRDFEGYRIYLGPNQTSLKLIAAFDRKDTTGFNTGLDSLLLPEGPPVVVQGDTMRYHYVLKGLRDGFKYFTSVTSFDTGNPRIESLESGKTQNLLFTIPGPDSAQAARNEITVFPNPYRVEARWDARRFAKDHYLWFANLPPRCTIRIYTLGGDLVHQVDFNGATYQGDDHSRGLYSAGRDFGVKAPVTSGSMYAWDMISRFNQAVASGMYIYSVEELPSGKKHLGKFVIIKSDRQE